ncbi:hypothetical protein [Nocardioides sp.]|uniref:hypothetical protein n=1 Tax=Nocardioides sp. TaxID=35761 RepID=UPI003D0AAD3D
MRIVRLTARRLTGTTAASAEVVARRISAALLAHPDDRVAHAVVSQVGPDVVELAVFLREGAADTPPVDLPSGWAVDDLTSRPEEESW